MTIGQVELMESSILDMLICNLMSRMLEYIPSTMENDLLTRRRRRKNVDDSPKLVVAVFTYKDYRMIHSLIR